MNLDVVFVIYKPDVIVFVIYKPDVIVFVIYKPGQKMLT